MVASMCFNHKKYLDEIFDQIKRCTFFKFADKNIWTKLKICSISKLFDLDALIFKYFVISEWQYDFFKLSTKSFKGTKILVSGWNMIVEYQEPIKTSFIFPPAKARGKYGVMSIGFEVSSSRI